MTDSDTVATLININIFRGIHDVMWDEKLPQDGTAIENNIIYLNN